jgi:hypothetical protein
MCLLLFLYFSDRLNCKNAAIQCAGHSDRLAGQLIELGLMSGQHVYTACRLGRCFLLQALCRLLLCRLELFLRTELTQHGYGSYVAS